MTINGPAPTHPRDVLQHGDRPAARDVRAADHGREPAADEAERIRAATLAAVRGTVQADILKEDQGQNTCIFSTEFSLKVMGDIQEYFIAQPGAQLLLGLDLRLSHRRGRREPDLASSRSRSRTASPSSRPTSRAACTIDDFAPNLSFFFSYGMDPEYAVLGRVARRIWAVAMRERYGANERSQKLKYHSQTSGRTLHAQEIAFNDIRTTLQALIAIYDNTNSLHTNAYDEAITTPTEDSVRRAMAIQMIINREWGLGKNENPNQGIVRRSRS